VSAATVSAGTVQATLGSFGTVSAATVSANTVQATFGSFGTVSAGTVQATFGSFGTVSAGTVQATFGSFGTVSAGTVQATFGSFGTVSAATVSANTVQATFGSFGIVSAATVSANTVQAANAFILANGNQPGITIGGGQVNGLGSGGGATGITGSVSAIAIGNGAVALPVNSVALGTNAQVQAGAVGSMALGANSRASGVNSIALGQGSNDGGRSNTLSVGAVGAERTISNVAPGVLGTDAVNVNQLNSAISTLKKQAFSGIASAIAMGAPAMPSAPGKTVLNMSYGNYGGQSAVGITFAHRLNTDGAGNWFVNGGAATGFTSGNRLGVRIGIGVEF
jgi:hypothetical protein